MSEEKFSEGIQGIEVSKIKPISDNRTKISEVMYALMDILH